MRGFHPIAELAAAEVAADRTRIFTGDGTPYLKVPGLKKLEGVALNGRRLEMETTRRYPTDPNHTQFEEETLPLFLLTTLPNGSTVLLRSILSNDGFFQAEEPIHVTGEWDEAIPAPEYVPPEIPKTKKGQR